MLELSMLKYSPSLWACAD